MNKFFKKNDYEKPLNFFESKSNISQENTNNYIINSSLSSIIFN